MLLQEAVNYAVTPCMLSQYKEGPCSDICSHYEVGDFTDYDTVYQFGQKVDLLTIEIENVNTDALKQLQQQGLTVYPQPEVIEIVQDKGCQKQFYREKEIPTADFHLIDNNLQIEEYLDFLPAVQKIRVGGYDGKGVQKIETKKAIQKGFDQPSVLEKFVPMKTELAVIVARNAKGEVETFPPVELKFHPEQNLVEYLFSPPVIAGQIQEKARQIACDVAEALEIVGILAVELFVSEEDQVYVNEIAPRPHNSGHHTIEANLISQYEQLTRALLNLPLGATDLVQPAVMVNLLGEEGHEGPAQYQNIDKILQLPGVHLHLYGKKQTYPYRKMGHVTTVARELDKAINKAKQVQQLARVVSG
jgi:5-(carboxyamino)imidazole ribonucleotide synthase